MMPVGAEGQLGLYRIALPPLGSISSFSKRCLIWGFSVGGYFVWVFLGEFSLWGEEILWGKNRKGKPNIHSAEVNEFFLCLATHSDIWMQGKEWILERINICFSSKSQCQQQNWEALLGTEPIMWNLCNFL